MSAARTLASGYLLLFSSGTWKATSDAPSGHEASSSHLRNFLFSLSCVPASSRPLVPLRVTVSRFSSTMPSFLSASGVSCFSTPANAGAGISRIRMDALDARSSKPRNAWLGVIEAGRHEADMRGERKHRIGRVSRDGRQRDEGERQAGRNEADETS